MFFFNINLVNMKIISPTNIIKKFVVRKKFFIEAYFALMSEFFLISHFFHSALVSVAHFHFNYCKYGDAFPGAQYFFLANLL
jgi:hypothetical protein